jgi:tetratricopeptide (TPR) repeat protein
VSRAVRLAVVVPSLMFCVGQSFARTVSARDETQFLMLKHWTGAVSGHRAGIADSALTLAWRLSSDDLRYIKQQLPGLLAYFDHSDLVKADGQRAQLLGLGHELGQTMRPLEFLERAAMLHADAAMFDQRAPVRLEPAIQLARPRLLGTATTALTLVPAVPGNDSPTFVTTLDGEVTGTVEQNANWPFARDILDRIPEGTDDVFVSTWYHATAAYLFRKGDFGEVRMHLDHADTRLRNDARLDFDRGCLSEGLAMNAFQQIAADQSAKTLFNSHGGGEVLGGPDLHLPTPADGNAKALMLYRHALSIDPGLVEAHVRAARLLELGGRFADANEQVRAALADTSADRVTTFYAHLFGARAAAALGRDDDADAHAQAALDLFPSAQSAILAASQVAFHRADAAAAARRLSELGGDHPAGSQLPVDPWRDYMFGAGRAVEPLLQDLWHTVPGREAR